MATPKDKGGAPPDVSQMTRSQKLAALCVVLGPESAAEILRQLEGEEIEQVSAEMAKLNVVTLQLQRQILQEFTEVAERIATIPVGGLQYAKGVLEKSVGAAKASDILNRVTDTYTPASAMRQILEMEAPQICNLIKQEQPQTIALIVSFLSPEKSSQLLALLPEKLCDQVVERLATLAPVPVEVLDQVARILTQRLGGKQTRALNQTGGVKTAAAVLNAMDRNRSKTLLLGLEERNPELGQAIRQKMFTFDDLVLLDTTSLQKILREVEMRDLAVSLKTATDQLKTTLLSCISRRAAETVNEEISFLGPLKLKEIDGSRARIIEVVRRLEAEGEIELATANSSAPNEVVV